MSLIVFSLKVIVVPLSNDTQLIKRFQMLNKATFNDQNV